jgi:hypothetical protein
MPAFPGGGAVVAPPVPLYPDYVSNATFVVGGEPAILDPMSGPKGSPLDAMNYPNNVYTPGYATRTLKGDDHSTGALSTGIGFDLEDTGTVNPAGGGAALVGNNQPVYIGGPAGNPNSVNNFSLNYIPGVTKPDGTAATDARLLYIGGGRSAQVPVKAGDWSNTLSTPNPWNALPILSMGNGGSRDAGAGPAFTGFSMKYLTAAAAVIQGAAISAGFLNRTSQPTGPSLASGANAFGSATAASATPV